MTTTQQDVALFEQDQDFLSRDVHQLFIDGTEGAGCLREDAEHRQPVDR